MTIKQFIEKAIEGGYDPRIIAPGIFDFVPQEFAVWNSDGGFVYLIHQILLDPLAWQAVGKVDGRNDYPIFNLKGRIDGNQAMLQMPWWRTNMHRMIDALAEGKTIEQFLETLSTPMNERV